jgi:hypothetical protein
MLFQGGDHGHRLEIIIGRANSIKTGLAGDDLEKDPAIVTAPVGCDDLDILDGQRWQPVGLPGYFPRGGD